MHEHLRVGHGYDVHEFGDAPPLQLGCITIPDLPALLGHSDGDALSHAIVDALLGATQMGDIGGWFPDTDRKWQGASGELLISETMRLVGQSGWRVLNIDSTVICERPNIGDYREHISTALESLLQAPVSVKGKRPDDGRGVSTTLTCMAVALLGK